MRAIYLFIGLFLCAPILAQSTTNDTPDSASIDAAYAKLEAKQHAATQPATISNANLAELRAELASLRVENAELKAALADMKNDKTMASRSQHSSGLLTTDKHAVFLSAREIQALPVFKKPPTKIFGHMALGPNAWAGDGTPMGFTNTDINSIGYVTGCHIIRVLDETSALVEIGLVRPDTDLVPDDGGTIRAFLIEGVSTKGKADDDSWMLTSWFKIMDTKKMDESTYLVAWPIVQSGKVSH